MSQQINLYNRALAPQHALLSGRNLAIASAASIALVLVLGSIADSRLAARKIEAEQATGQLKVVQERLQQLAQQVASAKPDPALQAELDKLTAQVASRATVLSVLEKGLTAPGSGYSEILRGLARQSLSGLWLTGISVMADSGEMELKGRTLDRALVAEYLRRLNDEKVFEGRSFAGLHLEQPKVDEAAAGKSKLPPAYLEFSLSGSQDKPLPPGSLAKQDGVADKPATEMSPDGKEKKS